MNFIKRPKIIISVIIFSIILIHFSQTNKIPPTVQKILDLMSLMIGPIFLLFIICLGVYGILIFYKNILPNISDAEMSAIERKLKQKRNINKSKKIDYNLKRETKTLVEKIRKLKQLYKKGTLTEIEFEQAKEKLLN